MKIAKNLMVGRININVLDAQIEIADKRIIIPYNKLNDSDWGFIYEKYVGQLLEDEGYDVKYNGIEKGFLDRGIDLIAQKGNQLKFVQCKYTRKIISKSRIEWILYKASSLLFDTYRKQNKKLHFMLVVSKKDECFSKRILKNFRLNFTETSKIEYPMLQYFLDHNFIQDKVKLEFREIEMVR